MNLNTFPCVSDADPGADDPDMDDDTYARLEEVRDAIRHLQSAEEELLRRWPRMAVVDEYVMDAVTELGFPPLPSLK